MKKVNNQKQLQNLLQDKKVLFVDMRSPVSYRDGHINGAVNLPLKNFINKIMGLDKTTTVIMYSTNFGDIDLVQGVKYAEQIGFSKIYIGEYGSLK